MRSANSFEYLIKTDYNVIFLLNSKQQKKTSLLKILKLAKNICKTGKTDFVFLRFLNRLQNSQNTEMK